MTTVDRPNRDTLDKALGIYRDNMRPFLVHHLRQLRGKNLEDAVESVLKGNRKRYEEYERHRGQGGSVEAFIDVPDFPFLIARYWNDIFDRWFHGERIVESEARLASSARNEVAHPGTKDLGPEKTKYYLFAISSVLGRIGRQEERRRVDELRAGIPNATTAALAEELAMVAAALGEQRAKIKELEKAGRETRESLSTLDDQLTKTSAATNRLLRDLMSDATDALVYRTGQLVDVVNGIDNSLKGAIQRIEALEGEDESRALVVLEPVEEECSESASLKASLLTIRRRIEQMMNSLPEVLSSVSAVGNVRGVAIVGFPGAALLRMLGRFFRRRG